MGRNIITKSVGVDSVVYRTAAAADISSSRSIHVRSAVESYLVRRAGLHTSRGAVGGCTDPRHGSQQTQTFESPSQLWCGDKAGFLKIGMRRLDYNASGVTCSKLSLVPRTKFMQSHFLRKNIADAISTHFLQFPSGTSFFLELRSFESTSITSHTMAMAYKLALPCTKGCFGWFLYMDLTSPINVKPLSTTWT